MSSHRDFDPDDVVERHRKERRSPRRSRLLNAFSAALMTTLGLAPAACSDDTSELPPGENPFPCDTPESVMIDGVDTGFVSCDGFVHRDEAVECPNLLPRETELFCGGGSTCTSDADCTEQPYGHCQTAPPGDFCSCTYGCLTDSDCDSGEICVCGDPVGRCAPADCTTDDDCRGDLLCASYDPDPYCGGISYTCQTEADECATADDCTNGGACTVEGDRRVCVTGVCAIGRPFLVDGTERLAPATPRADWCAEDLYPDIHHIPSSLRARLADHWTMVGLMEHASVAAFARSALQLLQLGAPPELVMGTQQALADETHHARMAFALASGYAGQPIGPGELEMDGALESLQLVDILEMVIEEGCIGETVAALEAAESAELTRDPVVQNVLEQIAADEHRHAELAWATLRWALDTGEHAVRDALEAAFQHALTRVRRLPVNLPRADNELELLSHGVFTDRLRAELRQDVVEDVIAPAFRRLMDRTRKPAGA